MWSKAYGICWKSIVLCRHFGAPKVLHDVEISAGRYFRSESLISGIFYTRIGIWEELESRKARGVVLVNEWNTNRIIFWVLQSAYLLTMIIIDQIHSYSSREINIEEDSNPARQ